MRVLVTGANGFVGRGLCERLLADKHEVWAAVRFAGSAPVGTREFAVGDLGEEIDWSDPLSDVDAVIHLAARVHVEDAHPADSLDKYMRINTEATRCLAQRASQLGVKRLIFMSSIAVNGNRTKERPFDVLSTPAPAGHYGLSKWEAEKALEELSAHSAMTVISVRAPMVYGPGAPGNIQRLIQLARTGIPVPLANVANKRTLISMRNLTDLLATCVTAPLLGGGLVIAGDEYSPSTAELFREVSVSIGRQPTIWPLPVGLLSALGRAAGKGRDVSRLVDSLEVQNSTTVDGLSWKPTVSFHEAIRELGLYVLGGNRR